MGQLLGTDASVPVAAKYEPHPITERFNLHDGVSARAVGRRASSGGANGRTAQNLVDDEPEQLGGDRHQAADDVGTGGARARQGRQGGPGLARGRGVGAATDAPPPAPAPAPADGSKPPKPSKPETRIVVFGDSDFVANGYLGIPGNKDLFLNTVNWLAQQENLISIRPRDPEDRRCHADGRTARRSSSGCRF